jgi:DNA-directed RNA polymerase subunit RPC12/RpoP
MAGSNYYCSNCGSQISSTDAFCPKCGYNVAKYGRNIKQTIVEAIRLSDNAGLADRITGSMQNASGSISLASEFIVAMPKEKRKEIGINDKVLGEVEAVKKMIQALTEKTENIASVKIVGSQIMAPVNISLQGDNIVITTNIEDSFNKIFQEIEKMNIDSDTKKQAIIKTKELKEEIQKETPDISKIRKIWSELKTLVPFLVSSAQLLNIVSKVLFG